MVTQFTINHYCKCLTGKKRVWQDTVQSDQGNDRKIELDNIRTIDRYYITSELLLHGT